MAQTHTDVQSKAAIAGHPLHPMLVPFPIAYLVGALFTDFAYVFSGDPFWARASLWLVSAGLALGVVAAGLGLTDFLSSRRIRSHRIAWVHFLGNASVLALAFVSMLARIDDAEAAVMPLGLVLSIVITTLLLFTGWLGGELAYRHRIGVIGNERRAAREPADAVAFRASERRIGPPDRRAHA